MCLVIKTYIKKPRVKISDLKRNLRDFFVSIENISQLKNLSKHIDRDYIEGCIKITYQETTILDFCHWDLVDQLWSYIITLIEQYYAQGSASTYFPDQPLQLSLQKKPGLNMSLMISSSKEEKIWNIPELESLCLMLDAAKLFFETMYALELINSETCDHEIQRIKTLQNSKFNRDLG